MRKIFLTVFLIFLIFYVWQCAEKSPLDIYSSDQLLSVAKTDPSINKSNLIDQDGSSIPGYLNGNIRSDRVTLNWTRSTDSKFIYYKLIRNDNALDQIPAAATTSYIDSNFVQHNTRYTYMVANVVRNGTARVDTVEIKTPRFETPTFVGYQIMPTTYDVRLIWENAVESATSYEIFKCPRPDSTFTKIGETDMGDTTLTDNQSTDLYDTFYYRVYGSNQYESPDTSGIYSVTIMYYMSTPSSLYAQYQSWNNYVRLSWNDNSSGETGFKIFRGESAGDLQQIATVPTNTTTYYDTDLSSFIPDSTYYYSVRAYNSEEESENSNVSSIVYNP
jgi:hypothetical protein